VVVLLCASVSPAAAALRLDFAIEITDGDEPPVTSTASLVLGREHAQLVHGDAERVWDLDERSVTFVDHAAAQWQRSSLHAEVAFREAEQAERHRLAALVWATDADVSGYSDAELEAAFGIPLGKDAAVLSVQGDAGDPTTWLRPDGAPLSERLPGSKRIPKSARPAWGVFVAHALHLHPRVRDDVVGGARFPASLTFRYTPDVHPRVETWTLTKVGRAPEKRSPPPDDYVEVRGNRPDIAALVGQVAASPVPTTADALGSMREAVAEALVRERPLDGFLAGLEFSLQREGLPSEELTTIATAAASDRRLDLIMKSIAPTSPAAAELALRALGRIKAEVRPHGRVVDVFRANILVGLHRPEEGYVVLRGYLEAQPHSAGPLHDLGLVLAGLYEMADAWRCFALARAVDPSHSLVVGIDGYERALMLRYPWFY